MKIVTILGSTGVIGQHTVEIIQKDLKNWEVHALVADKNYQKLAEQAVLLNPKKIVINDKDNYLPLKNSLADTRWRGEILAGPEAVINVAREKVDIVMSAIVGMGGIKSAYAAVEAGNNLAIANKESMVVAGEFILAAAARSGSIVIPVDSEQSALFQLLQGRKHQVRKLILTASGGPFFFHDVHQLENVTLEQALLHPTWNMGIKNTIDSATLVNKGLELIEATKLFSIEVDVIIHRESIIHAFVELVDGSLLAHLSVPDMKFAISAALYYPELQFQAVQSLNLASVQKLHFYNTRDDLFPALNLAKFALHTGGAMPLVYNTANEVAVEAFISKKISFLDISKLIAEIINSTPHCPNLQFDDIFEIEREVRTRTNNTLGNFLEV